MPIRRMLIGSGVLTRAVSLLLLGWPVQASAQSAPPKTPAPVAASAGAPADATAPAPDASRLGNALPVSGGLTASESARRAAATSVQGSIKREQVGITQAARRQIYWGAAPRLAFSGQVTRFSPTDVPTAIPLTNYLLNARLSLPLSDYLFRLVRTLRGASANEDSAVLDERAARVTAGANAQLAYYDWVRTRLEGVLAEQAMTQATAQLNRIQALQSVGRAADADLLQAQAFEADAELALRQSQTQHGIAEERLRIAIHAAPEESLSVGEDVLAPFPEADEALGFEDLYRQAVRQRLELQTLGKSRAALEDSSGIEASRALPTLEAVGNLTYANPNLRAYPPEEGWAGTWDVGLSLAWAVNDLGTSGNQADIVRAQAAQLDHQQAQVRDELRLEVSTALGALNQARLSLATAQKGERAAAAAYEARLRLQEQGMATALELIQAETARIQARLNIINAHITLRVARVQLDHAVGRDVGVVSPR